jgi:stage II sporulation protein D
LGADLSDDYHHFEAYISKQQAQSKWGSSFDSDWSKIYSAVTAVEGKIITYGGKPIDAEFFSLSTGMTESCANVWGNSLPYLVPVSSEWDKTAPDYNSSVKIKQSDLKAKVLAKYKDAKFDKSAAKWLTIKKRSASGNVLSAVLCGKTLTGDDIRSLFGLRSADFEVSFTNGVFVFSVKGYGHDVGMSQEGAEYLATQGKKWDEIVKYYFTGVSISDYSWT